ncbi:hypothetical protein P8C59_004676 [Phyllachora maydis]|uniref:Protein kinase domain-containing protein n=1 Tax=Phyllachora maydis TaxID=1825666 RepID=A0AAD9MCP8_9PEZI|nr:hypothetical protein P8C59_004676 [Phyllachora maydis]
MVFKATDLQTDQNVAIKCLTKQEVAAAFDYDLAVDDQSEELALHRRLGSHPYIVNLIDSFETDAHMYLVLEYCAQGDLYEAIRFSQGPRETEHVRCFMLELIDAVAYMHAKGVYHRDIKPENIFLSKTGSVKLGDFGLATTDRWTYETAVGSDRYMSPEQYDSAGDGYSPAQADIWAIGICLLNVLFARNPFTVPSEDDVLFLDFSRDKQSLFDVFPTMSHDTYEVIVQCMNLNPAKRSLIGARDALLRVVSFTTIDEDLDEFCSANRSVIASSNREPLRTPSIQSPHVEIGAFPWARALQASPQKPVRQLSAIPDDESYSEDLFSRSAETAETSDWLSGSVQSPSVSSILESSLSGTMQSLKIDQLVKPTGTLPTKATTVPGSLPIAMSKSRMQSVMSQIFGRKETVSKSWSDMWDEEEEEKHEHERQLQKLMELNSRTWSQDSKAGVVDEDDTPRQGLSPATKSATLSAEKEIPSIKSMFSAQAFEEDLGTDGIFVQEDLVPATPHSQQQQQRYSPPSKRTHVDKWAALGEARRKAHTGTSPDAHVSSPVPFKVQRQTAGTDYGFSLGKGLGEKRHFGVDEWVGGGMGRSLLQRS